MSKKKKKQHAIDGWVDFPGHPGHGARVRLITQFTTGKARGKVRARMLETRGRFVAGSQVWLDKGKFSRTEPSPQSKDGD